MTAARVPSVIIATGRKTDVLVVGIAPAAKPSGVGPAVIAPGADLAPGQVKRLQAALRALGATGNADDVHRIPGDGICDAPVVVAVGLGAGPHDAETIRRAAGAAARSLKKAPVVALAIARDDAVSVEAMVLGALLGAYRFTSFKAKGDDPGTKTFVLAARTPKAAVERARVIGESMWLARDLINTPPSALPPATLATAAAKACADLPLKVEVLDEKALRKGGFGGILGVGQGSVNPPRLIRIAYRHPKAQAHLAFVGKGITFDSGGLSLKPPNAMETMKCDMSGAAAVIAAMQAIARLKLKVNVTGWAACAENMPSGTAQRPSDVLTMYGGKTVEVLNTDAEGRLVLADALVRAQEEKPDLIIDIATLTGAASIALGRRTSGVMGNDDAARDRVWEASQKAGESMWHMPIPEELRPSIESQVADICNTGERYGGMMTGAVFLREFIADGTPWVHIDIAGPAFNDSAPYGYTPKGGTGAAIRTLLQVAEDSQA